MACKHSSAAIGDPCSDGDTPLAVVVPQAIGDIDTAHSNINGIFPFNRLPVELQNKIIGYSMIATDHKITFPCLTNAGYKPNITVGLMLANHRIYHEAHYQLRKQNTFVFGNFGSDLKTIASSIGPLKCRSGACGLGPLRSSLAKVAFFLGDEDLPDYGADKVHAFGCALRYLRTEITIISLHISLAFHTFSNDVQLSWFASALNKIKVQEKVTILGDEKYLDMSFGDLPSTLGMNMMPAYSHLRAYNPNIQYGPGWFIYQYVLEEHVGTQADSRHEDLVAGSKVLSEVAGLFGGRLPGELASF